MTPPAELTPAQHLARFHDCLAYAPKALTSGRVEHFLAALDGLETMDDARRLIPLLVATP